jgi:hypothetical protein
MSAVRRMVAAAAVLVSVAVLAAPDEPAFGTPPATTGATALVRGGHFSPDTPGVDVYLTAYAGGRSSMWLSDVGYGDVSPYRRLAPGLYVVSMRAHGAAPSTPPAISWTLDAKAGAAYTVGAVGMNAHLRGIVLRDRLAPPSAGTGLVRVIQAASRAPDAELVAGRNTLVARQAAFATTTAYAAVPAGTWTVTARAVPALQPETSSRVSVAADGIYSLVVLDARGSGIALRVVRDAAGSAVSPQGSVDAGGGGTARPLGGAGSQIPLGAVWAAVLGALTLLIAAFALQQRRPGAHRAT